jgi:hypothetical protein
MRPGDPVARSNVMPADGYRAVLAEVIGTSVEAQEQRLGDSLSHRISFVPAFVAARDGDAGMAQPSP